MKKLTKVFVIVVLASFCFWLAGCFKQPGESNPVGPVASKDLDKDASKSQTDLGGQIKAYFGDYHKAITAVAFYQAWETKKATLSLPNDGSLKTAILLRLQTANVDQDSGAAYNDSRRHFTRTTSQGRDLALTAYNNYLLEEMGSFSQNLLAPKTPETASAALDAWGRISHSWQDFFSHSVVPAGADSVYHVAWTANPVITGTPDTPNALRPPSYSNSQWERLPQHISGITSPTRTILPNPE